MTKPGLSALPGHEMFSAKAMEVMGKPGWLVTLIPGETTCLEHCSAITLLTAMPLLVLATHFSLGQPY